jgi:hypothetical protein
MRKKEMNSKPISCQYAELTADIIQLPPRWSSVEKQRVHALI